MIKKIYKFILSFCIFIIVLFSIHSTASAAYRDTIQAESTLLYYWPMDEASGATSLSALVGGTAINTTGATAGASGQVDGTAISFNGTSNFGATAASLDLTAHNKIVIESLFYTDSYNNTNRVTYEFSPNANNVQTGFFLAQDLTSGESDVFLKGNTGISYGLYTRPTAANWHHLVLVYDKSVSTNEVNLYIDGILKSPSSRPNNTNNTNAFGNHTLYLMSRGGTSLFSQGKLQHLAVYNDLSSDRIIAHAQAAGLYTFSAGVLSESTHTDSSVTLTWTDATSGNGAITSQLQRSLSGAESWSDVAGATTSPATDTGLSASTAYDYRVSYTDSSTTIYSNTISVTTNVPSTLYTVQTTDLWDNGYDNISAPRQSTFGRFVFTSDAASVSVTGTTTIYGSYPTWAQLGVRINGVDQSPLEFTANGTASFNVTLGSAGTTRTVEIISGIQSKPGVSVIGTFIDSVTYPNGSTFAVQTPTVGSRVLIYGDSISVGGNATNPESQGYAPILRNTYNQRVMVEGWGFRSLYDDANTAGLRSAFVSRVAGYTPSTIWIAIGTNDYGLNRWNATSFGIAYSALLDDLHTALPSARIFCQTPIVRSNESANASGNTTGDYRTQITTACNTRNFTSLIDGTAILTTGGLADGVHPSTAGHSTYATYISSAIETTSPIISNVSSTPNSTSSSISWSTNESASTKVDYGLTNSYGSSTTESDFTTRVSSHSTSLSSLVACTTYHYRVRSKDTALNETIDSDNTFTTTGCTGSSSVDTIATQTITTASGGSLSLVDASSDGISITIPSAFSGSDANFQAHKLDKTTLLATTSSPTGYSAAGNYIYELSALSDVSTKISSFDNSITITMTYADSDMSGLDESSLKIYRYDGSNWIQLTGCVVNQSTNSISCTTTNFSVFGLFGQTNATPIPASDLIVTSSGAPICNNQKPIGISPWLYSGSVVNSTSINLSFINYQSPIDKFVIEYGTKSGEYKYAVDGIPDTLTNFTVEKLKFNTVYYFRIRAGNGCATGSWSNEIAVKTANIVAFDRLNISNTSIEENSNGENQISITNYDVKIKVVDENQKPIVGAKVVLHSDPMETTTDQNGFATFSNVEKGDHKVLIAYGKFNGEQSINLNGDNKETNLNIVVTEQKILISPVAWGIISILIIVIIILYSKLRRSQ